MDLAMQLGGTSDALMRSMTEQEFQRWQVYAQRRMLPWRATHLYLAQIAMLIAQTMGGAKNVRLADFMFDPREKEASAEEAAEFFGFNPVKKDKNGSTG